MDEKFSALAKAVNEELERGDRKYGPHPGPKRGFGALRAELNELATELEAEDWHPERVRKEALQVAAMAMKFLRDCCTEESPAEPHQDYPFDYPIGGSL